MSKILGIPVGTTYDPAKIWEGAFVAPETFGAVGDGSADDTAAIQMALDTGSPVRMSSATYRISAPLIISKNNTIVQSYGEIIYSGTEYAVILDSCANCDVYFKKITATNGNGLKLQSNASKMCAYNNLEVGEITAKGTAILTQAEGGNQYNEIRFTKLNADICIDIQCSATGWNTETKWYGGHMGGNGKHATYAIKAVNTNGGNVTTHRFYNVGFEGVVDGCILDKVRYFVFNYPRTSEAIDNKAFILRAEVEGCIFRLSHFRMSWLDYSEHTSDSSGVGASCNSFSGVFLTDRGAIYNFTAFEIHAGVMYNCNQAVNGYLNITDSAPETLTLNPGHHLACFPKELLIQGRNCVLDTRYYHSGNINTLYVYCGAGATSTAAITDTDGREIIRVADYPYKILKLTAVEHAFSPLAPNGWIVEVLE